MLKVNPKDLRTTALVGIHTGGMLTIQDSQNGYFNNLL